MLTYLPSPIDVKQGNIPNDQLGPFENVVPNQVVHLVCTRVTSITRFGMTCPMGKSALSLGLKIDNSIRRKTEDLKSISLTALYFRLQ